MGAVRVVAADALGGAPAEEEPLAVEVRVRAGGRVHDRVRPADDLELVTAPLRAFGALVLAVADLDGRALQRFLGSVRVEDQLDRLPVALVQVVEVVEDVEEPVLEGELPRPVGLAGDVGVDGRRAALGEAPLPELVGAAGIQRFAREVEVVVELALPDLLARRADSNEIRRIPGPAEGHLVVAEDELDVDRRVRLALCALLRLLDEPDDRGVRFRQLDLGRVGGSGRTRERESQPEGCERQHGGRRAHPTSSRGRPSSHRPRCYSGRVGLRAPRRRPL